MEDTEIRGCFIPKGDTVMTIQASANRDEDVIEDGENYNALRAPYPHQAFGTARIIARARTCRGELSATSCCRCCSSAFPDPASVRWHGFGFRGPLNLPLQLQ